MLQISALFARVTMTAQQYFDKALDAYRKTIELVKDIGAKARLPETRSGRLSLQCQFDVIVQYVLLQVALADGDFSEIEGAFIDNITDNFDILKLFGMDGDEYNWQFAGAHLNAAQIKKVIGSVEKIAYVHMRNFAENFALYATDKDREFLFACMKEIAVCFILCDGTGTRAEMDAAQETVYSCLVLPWKKVIGK